MRAGKGSPNNPVSQEARLQLLRQDPKCNSNPGCIPPSAHLWNNQSPAPEWDRTQKNTPKNHSSRAVNSRHIARRHLGTWQQNKPDSRSCDKSETSSHLITVHAVYELTCYFTWYTHSIPDEHRANKPLKDSCELYKYWNQTLARYQPSEMQIGTHTDLHPLKPTAFKRSHHYTPAMCWCATVFPPNYFTGLGSSSLGIKFRFSSSLGKIPGCLTEGDRGLEGSPWSF